MDVDVVLELRQHALGYYRGPQCALRCDGLTAPPQTSVPDGHFGNALGEDVDLRNAPAFMENGSQPNNLPEEYYFPSRPRSLLDLQSTYGEQAADTYNSASTPRIDPSGLYAAYPVSPETYDTLTHPSTHLHQQGRSHSTYDLEGRIPETYMSPATAARDNTSAHESQWLQPHSPTYTWQPGRSNESPWASSNVSPPLLLDSFVSNSAALANYPSGSTDLRFALPQELLVHRPSQWPTESPLLSRSCDSNTTMVLELLSSSVPSVSKQPKTSSKWKLPSSGEEPSADNSTSTSDARAKRTRHTRCEARNSTAEYLQARIPRQETEAEPFRPITSYSQTSDVGESIPNDNAQEKLRKFMKGSGTQPLPSGSKAKGTRNLKPARKRTKQPRPASEKPFKCTEPGCQSVGFPQRKDMYRHRRDVHDLREVFLCRVGICPKSFTRKYGQDRHERNIHGATMLLRRETWI
ncbi:hypothetical protein EVG20_g11290 [Dentipellis fragilis]|uniref:C2H2-type domain-containing protein n=1 Tax=Dentipellis fragilis TaxID=205917 RepID=A0A4Y9XLB7_9AGAM|nr:hypothetical protein EVG20_g11290 [Dentipellis fragilis]